jgi:RNA-dependent RNA polymerase
MYRGSGGYQRGGGRGRGAYSGGMGRGGFSGGRDNRAYSSSSGSSSGQSNRPVLRPAAATRGRVTPPKQASPGPARVDSPMTPVREQSSYTLNGHTISETYTPSGSGSNVATTPPRSYNAPTSPTPTRGTYSRTPSRGSYSPTPNRGNYGGNTPGRQSAMHRPTTRNGAVNWAALQEYKIKILGMPKSYWTKAVHKAMSQYGTVVRIEMSKGSLDSSAWVTFQ